MVTRRACAVWFAALVAGFVLAGVANAGWGSFGSKPAPAAKPREVVEIEQRIEVDGPTGSTVVRESVEVVEPSPAPAPAVRSAPAGVVVVPGEQPPRKRSQFRDARREYVETKEAARLEHRAYRHARKASADATERNAVEAARDAYQAAK